MPPISASPFQNGITNAKLIIVMIPLLTSFLHELKKLVKIIHGH